VLVPIARGRGGRKEKEDRYCSSSASAESESEGMKGRLRRGDGIPKSGGGKKEGRERASDFTFTTGGGMKTIAPATNTEGKGRGGRNAACSKGAKTG